MHIILYDDRTYRGGHFFGKIPLHRKKEIQKAMQSGTRRVKFGKLVMNVLKVDPKVYAYAEYWECEKCYS
ncbi:MAG: hypothetical protein Q7N87_04910 [Candidatus Uhrbacteria bacterium]|nr:hypothetical protein [Candidatus Uhrbacteria bacterium]